MTVRAQIDLNGDVGESFGAYVIGHDAMLIPHVSSANIACGFHAGDPGVMRATVALARAHGVAVGAHPGLPDLLGFGRRNMSVTTQEVEDYVAYQIGALVAIAVSQGVRLRHVKPHGALYNMAAVDAALADAVARATAAVDSSLTLYGLSGSQLVAAAGRHGLRAASEVFADRAYRPDGSLVPRSDSGAVLHDATEIVRRAIAMATTQSVVAVDGTVVPVAADTICVHGDTPGAADIAKTLRTALVSAGVVVSPMHGV
jgi:UPF0271 protein